MDRNQQGFFTSLKNDVFGGLSPSRSLSTSPLRTSSPMSRLLRLTKAGSKHAAHFEPSIGTYGGLEPLKEGPYRDDGEEEVGGSKRIGSSGMTRWVMGQFSRTTPSLTAAATGHDLRLMLGVMGAPLAPFHVNSVESLPHLSIKDTPIETSSAHYILQQYTSACGGQKLQNSIRNAYAMGKLKMVTSEIETASEIVRNNSKNACRAETGGFVLWQMNPDMWYVELEVGGCKVRAGCNGRLVWRHTPWLGSHTAKGPVRPLRRALQGLDPRTTASMFADAKCIGERKIDGEECFVLKLCADRTTLKVRSEGPAEMIRHVLFGYFSQKTGLLVHLEDSQLTRIQSNGGDAVYWETTISSCLADYRPVDGIMIAHSGRSIVTLFRFGEVAMSHSRTKMEDIWTIDEVAFNIPGLARDCFIPPAELKSRSIKISALDKGYDHSIDDRMWKMEI